jgi:hypothetical protein
MALAGISSALKVLPSFRLISRSGSKMLNIETTTFSKPLKTLRTMTSAMVPTITPTTEMADMILMMLWVFLETR